MSIVLDGTSGLTSPAAVLTTTPLAVTSGGTGVTTSTGSGANVLGTSPTITGATITVASTAAPAFSAYRNASQTITTATATKISFDTEEFDTNSNFSLGRFTPTVAGYYQINVQLAVGSTSTLTREIVYLFKDGLTFKYGTDISANGAQQDGVLSALVYANGTTNYFEVYTYVVGTGTLSIAGGTNEQNYFQASMVRSA